MYDEETTSPDIRISGTHAEELSTDTHEALGQVMALTVRLSGRVDSLSRDVATMTAETGALRREIRLDRKGLAKHAAGRTSNRMAALLGALFLVYSEAAPVLHELWRGLVHR